MVDLAAAFKAVFIGLVIAASVIFTFVHKKHHDSQVEEMVEEVIEVTTGVEVDLSPTSPEDDPMSDLDPLPEDFVEILSDDRPDVFEDEWDKYFDEYNKIKEHVEREDGFPLDTIVGVD